MLAGGRPVAEHPVWVRWLVILIVLSAATPHIRFAGMTVQDRFFKMSPAETERALASHPPLTGPGRDVHCQPWKGAWDYACTFVYQPALSPKRMKVGVRVGHTDVKAVSGVYEADARYILQ